MSMHVDPLHSFEWLLGVPPAGLILLFHSVYLSLLIVVIISIYI